MREYSYNPKYFLLIYRFCYAFNNYGICKLTKNVFITIKTNFLFVKFLFFKLLLDIFLIALYIHLVCKKDLTHTMFFNV